MESLASGITVASGITSYGITSQRNHWLAESLQPAESLVIESLAGGITAANGITSHHSSHYSSHYSQRNY